MRHVNFACVVKTVFRFWEVFSSGSARGLVLLTWMLSEFVHMRIIYVRARDRDAASRPGYPVCIHGIFYHGGILCIKRELANSRKCQLSSLIAKRRVNKSIIKSNEGRKI